MQRIRSIVQGPKPEIEVNLSNSKKVYSTGDQINGIAIIRPAADTAFGAFHITFSGSSYTVVDSVTSSPAISGKRDWTHPFLSLRINDVSQRYPADMILRAGHTYELPFKFPIPEYTPVASCVGNVVHESVREGKIGRHSNWPRLSN